MSRELSTEERAFTPVKENALVKSAGLLSFDTSTANATHDVFAEEDKEEEQRDGDKNGCRHLDAVLRLAAAVGEGATKRVRDQTPRRIVRRDEVWPDVRVPSAHELEDENGDEGRGGKRDHDLPEVLPIGLAVDFRRQIEFVRDLLEVLTKQINIEDRDPERDDHRREDGALGRQPAIDHLHAAVREFKPRQTGNGDVVGDDHHFARDHHRGKQDSEDRFPAFEIQTGKSEGRENRSEQGAKGRDDADDQGVADIRAEIKGIEDGDVVAPQHVRREERLVEGADFRRRLQGGDDHPVEREEDDQGHEKKEGVNNDKPENAANLLGFGQLIGAFRAILDGQGHARGLDGLIFRLCFASGLLFRGSRHLEKLLDEIAIVVSHISSEPSSWTP